MDRFQRRLGILLAALGVVVLASATVGFTSVAVDRLADVTTASDQNANLGLVENDDPSNATVTRSSPSDVLDVTNRFGQSLTDVSVTGNKSYLAVTEPASIDSGATEVVTLSCASGASATPGEVAVALDVSVASSDESVSVTTTEVVTVDVDCS